MNITHSHDHTLAEMLVVAFRAPEFETRFLQLCRKYPQPVIYRALRRAQQTPDEKIKKSRLCLFLYLAKRYAHEYSSHPGH